LYEEISSKKLFCIKTISPNRPEFEKDCLLAEVQAIKSIDHPNVVRLYDDHFDETGFHFVMEYMDKGDLNDFLKSQKNYSRN
jgi:serine/threonine protein kinase